MVVGAEVTEARAATLTIVEDLDELEDRSSQARSGRPGVPVEQLGLQGSEEALEPVKLFVYECRLMARGGG